VRALDYLKAGAVERLIEALRGRSD